MRFGLRDSLKRVAIATGVSLLSLMVSGCSDVPTGFVSGGSGSQSQKGSVGGVIKIPVVRNGNVSYNPVSGVEVRVYNPAHPFFQKEYMDETDANGRFSIRNVDAEEYTFHAGYRDPSETYYQFYELYRSFEVREGQVVDIEAVLLPKHSGVPPCVQDYPFCPDN